MTLAIPAIFDILATTTMFIALTNVAASVFQMMRGFIVVITALMAMILLGRKQYIHHWLSLITIVLGVASVGYVSILDSQKQKVNTSDMATTSVAGVMMILGAQFLVGS